MKNFQVLTKCVKQLTLQLVNNNQFIFSNDYVILNNVQNVCIRNKHVVDTTVLVVVNFINKQIFLTRLT